MRWLTAKRSELAFTRKDKQMDKRTTKEILAEAKKAKLTLSRADAKTLDAALNFMADELIKDKDEILSANAEDVARAERSGEITSVMIDRLRLTDERINGMAKGIREVAALPSPLGRVLYENDRPNGLNIKKISIPFGVVAIIYESRPNVTSDAAALAVKSGNVAVLRGGKEAFLSARAIVNALRRGLKTAGLPESSVSLIEDTSRESAAELMTAEEYVDLLSPRGGKGLIRACVENATVPCIHTGTGICHVYVDKSADVDMALDVVENAKTSRPSVCNAAEVLLVHKDIANVFLPRLYTRLCEDRKNRGEVPVELRADAYAAQIIGDGAITASKDDFDTEFLDYIMAIRTVRSVDEAVEHISEHSTHHSEAIISEDTEAVERFLSGVDSAALYVNASTRFTDGGEFGFGCEMGISTQKNHPRGPMGLCELTTYKYVIVGNGQVRK